ncbi:MAG: nucleoside-diphosphate kinase [Acidimicrobiaceae bacterium]|nr:nucleoside-diphosphate kinase [Acidimicrobiaceae bacterium]
MNSTLVICKPDAVERALVGEIVGRLERKGLKIIRLELRRIDVGTAKIHYQEHANRPFFAELVEFITRSPSVIMEVSGPEDTWAIVRTLMGATDPAKAAPGTIRGDLGVSVAENLVHGSDSAEAAIRELNIFFRESI